jgi:maltooligosyltrehalose trehalohydrolase
MKHAHAMPFGAEYRAGATRFRLWAPSCERVRLELGRGTPRSLDMHDLPGGWHELTVPEVGPGAAYAFRVRGDLVVPIRSRASIPGT